MRGVLSIVFIFALSGSLAKAQETEGGVSRAPTPTASYSNIPHTGWAAYLGANAGYTGYNPNLDVEGAPTSLKLLGSYVLPSATGVFDFGYGIQNQTFSQDAAIDSAISTGVMELAARYQFENRWQLGAVYNQFFDKGSNYGANQPDVEFGGLQVLREFDFADNYLGRIGARAMASLNVDNETVSMVMIDFQIGWGGASRSTSTASIY